MSGNRACRPTSRSTGHPRSSTDGRSDPRWSSAGERSESVHRDRRSHDLNPVRGVSAGNTPKIHDTPSGAGIGKDGRRGRRPRRRSLRVACHDSDAWLSSSPSSGSEFVLSQHRRVRNLGVSAAEAARLRWLKVLSAAVSMNRPTSGGMRCPQNGGWPSAASLTAARVWRWRRFAARCFRR